jgi:hypothetical protein
VLSRWLFREVLVEQEAEGELGHWFGPGMSGTVRLPDQTKGFQVIQPVPDGSGGQDDSRRQICCAGFRLGGSACALSIRFSGTGRVKDECDDQFGIVGGRARR